MLDIMKTVPCIREVHTDVQNSMRCESQETIKKATIYLLAMGYCLITSRQSGARLLWRER